MAEYLSKVEESTLALSSRGNTVLPYGQVVLIGAGMDTRAYRLALPHGLKWFEVDRTEVLRVKHKLLHTLKRKVVQNGKVDVQSAGVLRKVRLRDGIWRHTPR